MSGRVGGRMGAGRGLDSEDTRLVLRSPPNEGHYDTLSFADLASLIPILAPPFVPRHSPPFP